jgi:diphosphate-dependent phosphofructokinase
MAKAAYKTPKVKIALLTAGGLAPCLSASVGYLIAAYTKKLPKAEIIGYRNGYMGLLKGWSITVTPKARKQALTLLQHGGSPIGNSRVKLTNVKDCVKRGLVQEGQDPLQVAAEQLVKDGITILHTIGGDDTNTTAADLAAYLAKHDYNLTVVGMPKTIDNDVIPIRQSLGAVTAAEQGAIFFENVVNEQSTSPRMLIIHEVMGRHCGWLTAATADTYRKRLKKQKFVPDFNLSEAHKGVDAIYLPELAIDVVSEAARLKKIMDQRDAVNIFLSEGAGVEDIVAEMRARGEEPERDAFGHVKIDKINPGAWFAKQFADMVKAEKVLVQKSGYFARSAKPNKDDLALIKSMATVAVASALKGEPGVIGHDEERGNKLRAIEFPRIKGGKAFDVKTKWFVKLMKDIGQPMGKVQAGGH